MTFDIAKCMVKESKNMGNPVGIKEPKETKPCPFCGGFGRVYQRDAFEWFVECDECDSCGHLCDTEDEAITAWNRRV